jgi:uncharacterized membrane protein YdbT with pleckstrin-like domain
VVVSCIICAVIAALVTWIIAGAIAMSAFRDRKKK